LALVAGVIALLPTLAIDRFGNLEPALPKGAFAAAPFAILGLILVLHAVGILARPRNGLFLVDVLILAAAFFVLGRLSLPLYRVLARDAASTSSYIGLGGLAFGLLVGGLAAVTSGRTSPSRAHWALSKTLWTCLAGALVAAAVYGVWVLGARPRDLRID